MRGRAGIEPQAEAQGEDKENGEDEATITTGGLGPQEAVRGQISRHLGAPSSQRRRETERPRERGAGREKRKQRARGKEREKREAERERSVGGRRCEDCPSSLAQVREGKRKRSTQQRRNGLRKGRETGFYSPPLLFRRVPPTGAQLLSSLRFVAVQLQTQTSG